PGSWNGVAWEEASGLLSGPLGPALEGRPARIGHVRLAGARGHVAIAAAHRAEPPAALSAEGLHGQRQARLGLEQRGEIELPVLVHVGLEVVGSQLPLPPAWPGRARS